MSQQDFIDRELYPFQSRWLSTTAGNIHYIDEGVGPALLFVHGSPTWSFLYRNVITALRDQFRCIAIDHLGFGLSDRPTGFGYTIGEHTAVAAEIIDRLELDDYTLVCHDWGGPIGLSAAALDADRLSGAVLTNTILWPVEPLANRLFSVAMSTRFARRQIIDRNILVEKFLLPGIRSEISRREADHYRKAFGDAAARAALAVTPREIRAAGPLLEHLEQVTTQKLSQKPIHAVWGMRDKVFRARYCLPRLSGLFADLEITEVDHAGHFVAEDAPEAIIAAIRGRA